MISLINIIDRLYYSGESDSGRNLVKTVQLDTRETSSSSLSEHFKISHLPRISSATILCTLVEYFKDLNGGAMRGLIFLLAWLPIQWAQAFCGFFVAKADSKLFNKASQVAMVRQDDKTVLTMANDYQGEAKEFAIVIPVPTVLKKDQIHIAERGLLEHLDAYTSPRLVEYFDPDPCSPMMYAEGLPATGGVAGIGGDRGSKGARAKTLGIKIEAQYSVGEYDILILSASQSHGLVTWLNESGYKMPARADKVLSSYIKQGLKFFVAKVNLKEQARLGYTFLRPIQIAYESPKFMLPIRLGTVNASGAQDLLVYALSSRGRVETTNYRTVKLPTGQIIPPYVKEEFAKFYTDMFAYQVDKEKMRVVFTEYAWDMGWCDPCAADPLSKEELRNLGVFWLDNTIGESDQRASSPRQQGRRMILPPAQSGSDVFVTRLHVRYTGETFPEDLVFQETSDRTNFQGRYVIEQPFTGKIKCAEGELYTEALVRRMDKSAQNLANLTGWKIADIRSRIKLATAKGSEPKDNKKWYQKLWGK